MAPLQPESSSDLPSLGGARRERDPQLWAALLGNDPQRRADAVRTITALEQEMWYARQLLEVLGTLAPARRARAGDAIALLGDFRFVSPFFMSEMLFVPAGEVLLGSHEYREEQPPHVTPVGGFALAQFPVTQAAYAAFVADTRHTAPRGWRHGAPSPEQRNAPVTGVSARDAEAYCRWLSAHTGFRYRLPTEPEWVLAARSSQDRRQFPWGEHYDSDRANVWGSDAPQRLCAVGLFPRGASPYGHQDLAGNIWEWCSSLYWPYPYHALDGREDPQSNELRVMHGGSWRSRPISARCAARQGEPPTDRLDVVGFRIARDGSDG